jgi:hypothetical protein
MPEGFFIFAIPSDVVAGTYSYSENTTGNIFEAHNLVSVGITYGNQSYATKSPNLGNFGNNIQETKTYLDYLLDPPFNMKMNPDLVTLDLLGDGAKKSVMPNVWLKMTNLQDKTRMVPYLSDGSRQDEARELQLEFAFGGKGNTVAMTYCIYLYYCEDNLILNTSKKKPPFFMSPFVAL